MLTLNNLSVARGGRRLIQGLNLTIGAGRAVILHGPNGSGKTSLLRTIAGLQLPAEGQVEVDEDSLIFAGHLDAIKAQLTVQENLEFWQSIYGSHPALIARALTAFNLENLSERAAASLSAGQKRRLGLARLIVADRAVWILDEPTVSLDTASITLFDAALAAHLAQGGVAMIATHVALDQKATILDMQEFVATAQTEFDPFLEGSAL
ncbi:MAG: heme ABC exporter ATP-binding protein CcmA [Paracoccaceae bacterium]|nr:heme ABC exporter ATP-binding protein CcmA [Paracoccaceae bacterium]